MFDVPVLLIVFNRPETTGVLIEALKAVKPARIFISADGPRANNADDITDCAATKSILKNIDWDCTVEHLFHEENLGCHWAPRKALTWFFSQVEEGIILEDDCIPGPDFFYYCRELLARYRHDESVFTINGSNLGYYLENNYSYTFSKFMNMTGWATWRRSATQVDYSLGDWKKTKAPMFTLYERLKQNIFDIDIHWLKYWKHKFDLSATSNNVTWWDWQWINHQILNKKYSIVPARNLVTNIGFNEKATHTKEVENPAGNIPIQKLDFPLKHPSKIYFDTIYDEQYVKWVWCYHKRITTPKYILNGIKNYFAK